jgi:hypothetical protein
LVRRILLPSMRPTPPPPPSPLVEKTTPIERRSTTSPRVEKTMGRKKTKKT